MVAEPLITLKALSRDRSWKWPCYLQDGRPTNAIEIQRQYVELVREFCPSLEGEWRRVLEDWDQVLTDLERDPLSTADRLDWTAKFRLLDKFRAAENLTEEDPWLRSLDLSYHLLDRQQGLFYALMEQGNFRLPFPQDLFTCHSMCPPPTTRAAVRGRCIEKFGNAVRATQWDYILLQGSTRKIELDLRNLFDLSVIRQSLKVISAAQSVDDLAVLSFAKII
jgi:proteasome accessory factor A